MSLLENWKSRANQLRVETYALYLACKHPGTPWYAKVCAVGVVGYLFSPIDLIPDFIPVLGYLDDLIIVPIGITLVLKMIPEPVMEQCRASAGESLNKNKSKHWVAAGVIIAIWLLVLAAVIAIIMRIVKRA